MGLVETSGLVGEYAQQMKRVRVTRVLGQHVTIDFFSVGRAA